LIGAHAVASPSQRGFDFVEATCYEIGVSSLDANVIKAVTHSRHWNGLHRRRGIGILARTAENDATSHTLVPQHRPPIPV
jgi:hypothetical protein